MKTCRSMLKVLLVTVLLVPLAAPQEKFADCCTQASVKEFSEPILHYLIQKPPCKPAVIFQVGSGYSCYSLRAPWVRQKIGDFHKARTARSDASSPSSSTSSIFSSSSTSSISWSSSPSSSPSPSSSSSSSLLSRITSTASSSTSP